MGIIDNRPVSCGKLKKVLLHSTRHQRKKDDPFAKVISPGTTVPKIHRRNLPSPPKRHAELSDHPFGKEFREAENLHLKSHDEMGSWKIVDHHVAKRKKSQVLDCMWVYVYKFNKHGWLQKCKARLVVRGDQQLQSALGSTYASTLAGRSFRTLMAIAARFDLELIQFICGCRQGFEKSTGEKSACF